jgi:predicted DCC family thiol-disulfide oxidoreductase YuxK
MLENQNRIILFDGVCNFCNSSVNTVIKLDKKRYFRFAPIQSEIGTQLMLKHGLDPLKFDSVILIDNNRAYTSSSAVINILKKIGGIYSLAYAFIIVPPFIRNGIYKWVARNRYKWFGKKDTCMVPTPETRSLFIG